MDDIKTGIRLREISLSNASRSTGMSKMLAMAALGSAGTILFDLETFHDNPWTVAFEKMNKEDPRKVRREARRKLRTESMSLFVSKESFYEEQKYLKKRARYHGK